MRGELVLVQCHEAVESFLLGGRLELEVRREVGKLACQMGLYEVKSTVFAVTETIWVRDACAQDSVMPAFVIVTLCAA